MPQNTQYHNSDKQKVTCMWEICHVPAFYCIAYFAVLCWPCVLWQAFETRFCTELFSNIKTFKLSRHTDLKRD